MGEETSSVGSSVQERITAFWRMVAPHYEADPANMPAFGTPEYRGWVELFERLLPPSPSDVLDVGTGTGFVALIAASLGHRVIGVDLAGEMLAAAREHAKARTLHVDFVEGDAVRPPFEDAVFDIITSRYLLWTLREPDRATGTWLRLLRPGGRLVVVSGFWFIGSPDDEAAARDEREDVFARYYTPDTRAALPGMHFRTHQQAVELFERSGFLHIVVEDVPPALVVEPEARPFILMATRR